MSRTDGSVERIDERALHAFRASRLSPAALLALLDSLVRLLVRLGIGVGKSVSIDGLLADPETYRRYDLVLYAASSWEIIHERTVVADPSVCPVPMRIIRPRPVKECGPYRHEWTRLEEQRCFTYAKATLCRDCQAHVPDEDRCFWPIQLDDLEGVGMIVLTEQQLVLNRSLLSVLLQKTGAKKPLIILDEALFLDRSFEIVLDPEDLSRFRSVLADSGLPKSVRKLADRWVEEVDALLDADVAGLAECSLRLSSSLLRHSFEVQALGIKHLGSKFSFSAYDLLALQWSSQSERWRDSSGRIHFVSRPYLNRHMLIMSAHLSAAFTGHRLGCGTIPSPFENVLVRHSATTIHNIRSPIGAIRNFTKNLRYVLDTFAAVILRNVAEGRTTLLVARMKLKEDCAKYLERRLAGWGIRVRFVHDGYGGLPTSPEPTTVPIVHYGIRGVNAFENYETAYCLHSYYVPTDVLNHHVHETEPEGLRTELEVLSGPERVRRARPVAPKSSDAGLAEIANLYLRKLEVDPPIQAVGRVRFLTRPREVVFFTMHDIAPDVGEVVEHRTLASMLEALGVPSAREIDRWQQSICAKKLTAEGRTATEIAAGLGISRRTVFYRLRSEEGAGSPLYKLLYGAPCTLPRSPRGPQAGGTA